MTGSQARMQRDAQGGTRDSQARDSQASDFRWISFLFVSVVVFYWKLTLTSQFSLLTESEGVNQSFSWLQEWIRSVRSGTLPIWDTYAFSGHSFPGEMQTAIFYPLHLVLALIPSGRNYALSPQVYQYWMVFTHFLAAVFMYALIRYLSLGHFAAYIGGISFSLGGFVSRMPWPHMLESSIWLPLVVLFFLRVVSRPGLGELARNAGASGIFLGLSTLAGGLHVAVMQALAVGALGLACILKGNGRGRVLFAVVLVGAVGFAVGAVQLFSSAEYSARALRFLGAPGALPGNERIPYDFLQEGLHPAAFVALLMPSAFNSTIGTGEVINPYLGVLPLAFAVVGIWSGWREHLVRSLTILAIASFLYSLGWWSLLHGVLYSTVPGLWIAREAGRIVYLTDFCLVLLAAYGVNRLFSSSLPKVDWPSLRRVSGWAVVAVIAILLVSATFGRPEITPHVQFSLLVILLAYAVLSYVLRGNTGVLVRFLTAALILFDLAAFNWSAPSKREVAKRGTDQFQRIYSCRDAVAFLKAQPGTFRVEVAADPVPNLGNFFGIETTFGAGATLPRDYAQIMGRRDLLNVRYRLTPASVTEGGSSVWSDALWRIHEIPNALPRAWIVHKVIVEPVSDRRLAALSDPQFDPRISAIVDAGVPLEGAHPGLEEHAAFTRLAPTRLLIKTHAASRGLLVLSEMYYPGWRAAVNGVPARIYKTDVSLRGILVPKGDSEVVLEYRPASVLGGGAITVSAIIGIFSFWIVFGRRTRPIAASSE